MDKCLSRLTSVFYTAPTMRTPIPATISSELTEKIAVKQINARSYLDENSLEIRLLMSDAKKLVGVDAFAGHIAIAEIYQLTGNLEKTRYHLNNAKRLSNNIELHGSAAACFVNLGCFGDAQSHYEIIGNPERGMFSKSFELGICSGAFDCLNGYIDQAEKMRLDLTEVPVENIRRVQSVLSDAKISDAEVASILDLAGEVMREENVFYVDETPKITIDDGEFDNPKCVYISYKIDRPGRKVAEMSNSLFIKIATRLDRVSDAIHVSFCPM